MSVASSTSAPKRRASKEELPEVHYIDVEEDLKSEHEPACESSHGVECWNSKMVKHAVYAYKCAAKARILQPAAFVKVQASRTDLRIVRDKCAEESQAASKKQKTKEKKEEPGRTQLSPLMASPVFPQTGFSITPTFHVIGGPPSSTLTLPLPPAVLDPESPEPMPDTQPFGRFAR